MTARSLQAVLRKLADAAPASSDGELLRRFLTGDEDAFAELVRRHGRLVWGVCRHLAGSDAEADDAFQATFLVLFRNAKKVRDDGRLSAWLHGVAYKVCAKSRQAAKRREARERATAASERNGSAVPDSAWDRALAAVHEEVAKLPETLRVPFVLCCLEGRGVTEAAEQLGWKLGTLSGRLTRAKDAILARLDARGLTLGVVVGLGMASPPEVVVAKAVAVAQAGFAVPSSVLQLTQGVIGMSLKSTKVLAAALLLTCGLGLGAGRGWVATAEAQAPTKTLPAKVDPADEVKRLQAELDLVRRHAEDAARQMEAAKLAEAVARQVAERERAVRDQTRDGAAAAKTKKWEYDFVAVSEMGMTKFVELLQNAEDRGWEYNGLTKYTVDGKMTDVWVFRRPAKGVTTAGLFNEYLRYGSATPAAPSPPLPPATSTVPATPSAQRYAGSATVPAQPARTNDAKAIEAQIADLQAKLAAIKSAPKVARERVLHGVEFGVKDLPFEPHETMELLVKLTRKKFPNKAVEFSASGNGIAVEGDKEAVEWVVAMVRKLTDK